MLLKGTNLIFIRSSKSFNISEDPAFIVLLSSLYVIWLVIEKLQNDYIVTESVNAWVCMWLSLGLNFGSEIGYPYWAFSSVKKKMNIWRKWRMVDQYKQR
jgi:hypothetical protein